jgi:hypothetical protein
VPNKEANAVENTVNFWNERYGIELSREDAKEAVRNIAGFFQVLSEWERRNLYKTPQSIAMPCHECTAKPKLKD